MTLFNGAVLWSIAGLTLCSLLIALRKPLALLLKLALRSAVGLAALAAGQTVGLSLGVNLVNALVLGLLGVPGFGLLLMVQWALR